MPMTMLMIPAGHITNHDIGVVIFILVFFILYIISLIKIADLFFEWQELILLIGIIVPLIIIGFILI